MKCPKCGRLATPTNVGRRLAASALGIGGSMLGKIVGIPEQGTFRSIRRGVCPENTYACSHCKYFFSIKV